MPKVSELLDLLKGWNPEEVIAYRTWDEEDVRGCLEESFNGVIDNVTEVHIHTILARFHDLDCNEGHTWETLTDTIRKYFEEIGLG